MNKSNVKWLIASLSHEKGRSNYYLVQLQNQQSSTTALQLRTCFYTHQKQERFQSALPTNNNEHTQVNTDYAVQNPATTARAIMYVDSPAVSTVGKFTLLNTS